MNASSKRILSDEQLVVEYLNGSKGSLGILYERYYTKVFHQCLSYTRNREDAFDFAQDVMMKAFCNLSKFVGKSRFSTWLFSITRNHCLSQTLKRQRLETEDLGSWHKLLIEETNPEGFEERRQREEVEMKLNDYLGRLPENDRKMLELKYLHNYSVRALQQEFVLSASAVKMRLLRARNRIGQLHRGSWAA